MSKKGKTLTTFKKVVILDGKTNKKEIYTGYQDYCYKRKASLKIVRTLRNNQNL